MADQKRFLLGYGERLTAPVHGPSGNEPPGPAYSFAEALQRLGPEAIEMSSALGALPRAACPDNESVAVLTLHPQSLAKSYHPKKLLDQYNLRQVGSRPVEVTPERWTKLGTPAASPSTELYVAGDRKSFDRWSRDFAEAPLRIHEAIQRLEEVHAPKAEERLRHLESAERAEGGLLVELVLHAAATDEFIVEAFATYSEMLGIEAGIERRLYAGGLCFVPAEATPEQLSELARFSFLRVARPLSRIRAVPTIERSVPMPNTAPSPMPTEGPLNADIRVAVFDGGLEPGGQLEPWVRSIDLPGIGRGVPEFEQHGFDVTSALLFGSLQPGSASPRPYTQVDHYRVLDQESINDPFEMYDVIRRIESVLSEKHYDFVNLSVGPYVPIEDDDVHPWTAILDSHLAGGQTLATIAVGNNGEPQTDTQERRIQVPSDCVNALSLGAADSVKDGWGRASYSALGPGRAPGFVKPDVLEFGGTATEPFIVYTPGIPGQVAYTAGTSFASPSGLRRAIAVRTHFGERLTPLGIKALLIHSADSGEHAKSDVGWGRLPPSIDDIMVCGDGQVRIVYQGLLTPAQYLRAQIPLPIDALKGNVRINATFTYATETDPQDPGSYSRAGLGITFRPHDQKFENPDAVDPKPRSFFRRNAYDSEGVLRRDAQQWETTLNRSETLRGSSLRNPVFDVHYNARLSGGQPKSPRPIPYALVVSVESPRTVDLYDRVVRAYAGRLEALIPVMELPIQI
jgi:hypothetical protein